MEFSAPHNVVVVVDGPDPDNFAAILAATSAHFGMNVVAVIMTGRPVSAERGVSSFAFNPYATSAVTRDNALHAKGILVRHDRETIPVFMGNRAPYTTVPHYMHIHERVTDIYDDAHAGHQLAGGIDDAVIMLSKIPGTLHFVCGGPLTDVAYFMRQPLLHGKFGILTAQLGMFGTNGVNVLAGGRRQFNATCDAGAAHSVLFDYPGPVYMVPTDITKLPAFAFNSADELRALATTSTFEEIADMYEAAWPHMWGPRNMPAHVHDFHPAELMSLLLKAQAGERTHHLSFVPRDHVGRYAIAHTGIEAVPYLPADIGRWGEIDLCEPVLNAAPSRFWADGIVTTDHHQILAAALNSPAFVPEKARAQR
ncbi:MAG TPA: nucleoside hydrolase [Candidatus Saccharimonadales bacterium]|nr:nucleoside hydrolase [Candidatus Saccharimonadales bacterium]